MIRRYKNDTRVTPTRLNEFAPGRHQAEGISTMYHQKFIATILCGVLTGFMTRPSCGQDAAANQASEKIINAAENFVAAFNRHDSDSLAEMYAENAEVLGKSGTRLSGVARIRDSFASYFLNNPKAQIAVQMDSVRLLTPGLALEEGTSTLFDDGTTASYVSRYILLHSKVGTTWKIAASKVTDDAELNAKSALDDLSWMLGEWVDEGAASSIHWNCIRSENGNFLLRAFDVQTADGREIRGTQRIAWDPVRKRIRSWAFDSTGGFVEAVWSKVGDVWINKAQGYQADGTAVSATNYIIPIRGDRYLLRSVERIAGSEKVDDIEVVVVRRGPRPAAAAK